MYDLIIIGAGPAGLSAALYASRAKISTLVLEKSIVGGLITTTTEVENYPGSEKDATGTSITTRMYEQAVDAGAEFDYDEIEEIQKMADGTFVLKGISGEDYKTKTITIATGTVPKMLGSTGEEEFRGRGVSYCATCDAGFFIDKHVAVVGGGDSALKEAEYLTRFVAKLTLIHRRDQFRAHNALVEKIKNNEKINIIYDSIVESIEGNPTVDHLIIKNIKTNETISYPVDGIFIFAGYQANSELVADLVQCDEKNYIITNEDMMTSVDGIFAVGDVRQKTLRQVITAAADGAIAGVEAEKYITEKFS